MIKFRHRLAEEIHDLEICGWERMLQYETQAAYCMTFKHKTSGKRAVVEIDYNNLAASLRVNNVLRKIIT